MYDQKSHFLTPTRFQYKNKIFDHKSYIKGIILTFLNAFIIEFTVWQE